MTLKLKKLLFSENGMKLINALFFASVLVRNRLFTICVYALWTAFLIYTIRHTKSAVMIVFYTLLTVYTVVTILICAYLLVAPRPL